MSFAVRAALRRLEEEILRNHALKIHAACDFVTRPKVSYTQHVARPQRTFAFAFAFTRAQAFRDGVRPRDRAQFRPRGNPSDLWLVGAFGRAACRCRAQSWGRVGLAVGVGRSCAGPPDPYGAVHLRLSIGFYPFCAVDCSAATDRDRRNSLGSDPTLC